MVIRKVSQTVIDAASFFVDGNESDLDVAARVKVRRLRPSQPKSRKPRPASWVLVATTLAGGNSYTLARVNIGPDKSQEDALSEARDLKAAHERAHAEVVDIRYFGAR